ncbi:DUF998 domain-containing protein [Streptomyces phytohabitans]|uniref:DUF998 domain-containing protein n=1 Tax=Streptomyces phytohabitans TaxID=1150371 RepID=UPI00345BDE91
MGSASYRGTGLAFLVACTAYWVGEAVAAHAWSTPAYSYADNLISDLGVTSRTVFDDRIADSPRSWALNGAWILNALLVSWAATRAPGFRAAGRLGQCMFGFTLAYAVGLVTIAFFHETPSETFPFHFIGAVLAIGGGNVVVLLAAVQSRRLRWPPLLTGALTVLATVGSVSCLLHPVLHVEAAGTFERLAAYPVLAAQLVAGVALLLNRPAARPATP